MNKLSYYIGRMVSHCNQLAREANAVRTCEKFGLRNVALLGDVEISGHVEIGENCVIRDGTVITSGRHSKVVIGRDCGISYRAHISALGRQTEDYRMKFERNIAIGDYVWIGANVVITPGRTVGSNVVIGANSVVTCDIPDNCVYGGVPARLIRKLEGRSASQSRQV